MLSIGKLAPGRDAAAYYLQRVGCPLDYYVGRGEAPGVWLGRGTDALGLRGAIDDPQRQEQLRRLLAGQAADGTPLVPPVLRADPRSRVSATAVVTALTAAADARGVDVPDLLRLAAVPSQEPGGAPARAELELLRAWQRIVADLERARRRPTWPAPTLPAELAQRMLARADLDPTQVLGERTPTGRFRDRLARALRHREDRVDARLPGLDLTLSAPKSVSLLWALTGDDDHEQHDQGQDREDRDPSGPNHAARGGEVAGVVRGAHRLAVQEAIAYLELTCTDALRGHHRGDGTDRRVGTDGLVAARFEHRSSRCGDPQLHTHVVVANLLHGHDGRWSALDTRAIYTHARTAGFVYQAVLRGELTRRLGVSWTPVRNGQAEIAGIPVGLLRLFSKRRAQIEAQLQLLGLDGPVAAQVAALDTRPTKTGPQQDDGVPELGLRARWQAEATSAGHQLGALAEVLHRPDSIGLRTAARAAGCATGPVVDDLAERLLGAQGLTLKRSTFDRRELLRGVCEQLPAGLPIRLVGLRAVATRVLRDPRVVPLLADAPLNTRRYSTRELLSLEVDALAVARRRQLATPTAEGVDRPAALVAVVPEQVLAAAQDDAAQRGLTVEQTAMVTRLLTGGAGVDVVVGAAGSGKTSALAVAARAWQTAGVTVQGTALAAIAARVLQDGAGIPSCSLQRLLQQLDQPAGIATQLASAGATGGTARLLPPGGVLIVDEAGMVGTRTLHRLLTLTEHAGTKLVLVGDPHQLPEIEAGGLFAALALQLPGSLLQHNQRQRSRWEQRALRELRDGDVLRAVSAYARHGRARIADSIPELTTQLLHDYEQHLTAHAPEQVLVIASSRSDARRLNAQLRQWLLAHDRLGPDELRVPLTDPRDPHTPRGERGYRVGEQVLVTVNDYPRGLLNGTRGTVTGLHPERQAVSVRLDDGRTVLLDRTYLARGQLAHGYALTAHKAQGLTVDVALLWGTRALSRETGYVAMSRGRDANHLYTTWDLLQHDPGPADSSDLDRPAAGIRPDRTARRGLARAALTQRLAVSSRQRTASSWWRPRAGQTEDRTGRRLDACGRAG